MRALIAGLLLLTASAGAAGQTLNPIADAYVRGGTWAGSNFGTATRLYTQTSNQANSNRDTYLKFDTASVSSISAALLRVKASVSNSIGMSAYAVANTTWGETTITWNNKPARGSVLASVTVTGTTFVYYVFDVTAYVIAEKAAGRNVVSFALHNPSNSSQTIWMDSRENAFGPPELVLTANPPPTVGITAPASGTVFTAPANITVSANASDPNGTVTQVQFFANGAPIGTDMSAPYSIDWTNVAAGSYSLTAVATDNDGATTTSAPVNITVNSPVAQLYFVHVDHLNTPRLVANQAGQTVWRWDQQEPFGVNVPDENPSALGIFEFPLRFPGQYADKETNLHYNYFRDYDSSIGRYIQSDPIGLAGGINTYAYVSSNPLLNTDPLGLTSHGCGAGKFHGWIPNLWLRDCCDAHDACYEDCKKQPTKSECDKEFCDCVYRKCTGWGNNSVCRNVAMSYCISGTASEQAQKSFDESRQKCKKGPLACGPSGRS